MSIFLVTGLVWLGYAYAAVGVLLLPWWYAQGLGRLDRAAARGPWGFKLMIAPGLVALWVPLLRRARTADGRPAAEHNAHHAAAGKEGRS